MIQNIITPNLPLRKPYLGNQRVSDLGGLSEDDVWLSDGNLLILKGGTTSFTSNDIDDGFQQDHSPNDLILNPAYNHNNAVTYANSGKLAIAPAPPSFASSYVYNPPQIKYTQQTEIPPPQIRVPKHIQNNLLEPFVPKNTQIPHPQTNQQKSSAVIVPNSISKINLQPVQNAFRPSEKIIPSPQIAPQFTSQTPQQYKISLGASPINSNVHVPRPASTFVAPHKNPNAHTGISSNILQPLAPSALGTFHQNHLHNNRKTSGQYRTPGTQQGYQQLSYEQQNQAVNPLLEYLKTYSVRNKMPLSALTGNAQHRNYQKHQINGNDGIIWGRPLTKPNHRAPKTYSAVNNQVFHNYNHRNNPYYSSRRHTSNNKSASSSLFQNLQQRNRKSSTSYIKKKTQFLDYLTYIKPYLPSFVSKS